MNKRSYISILSAMLVSMGSLLFAQTNNPAPYTGVSYFNVPCNQTGPSNTPTNFINDFINSFNTTGANVNIVNNSSGCNGLSNNYIFYGCQHFLAVSPSQTITCNVQSGITFPQGFAIWIDWNQDNAFNTATERVAWTPVLTPAGTWGTMSFVIPPTQAPGTYRMRLRCSYATSGNATNFDAYNQQSFGETEDYNLYVGTTPATIMTATVTSPQPTVCAGQNIVLNVAHSSTSTVTYTWTGPGSFSSTLQNPTITPASQTMSGVYNVTVSNGACPVAGTTQILVVNYPTYNISPLTSTICQGTSTNVGVTNLPLPTSQYSFNWTGPGSIFNPILPSTTFQPPLQPASTWINTLVYTVVVTPTAYACPTSQTMSITVNNPPSPTISPVAPLCNNSLGVQLIGTPFGGVFGGNVAVTPNGFFTPSLATTVNNFIQYTVNIGQCTSVGTGSVEVSKFHTAALTTSLSRCALDGPFNLMNIVQDTTTGYWSGTNVNGDYFSAAGLATGNYSLTYYSPSAPNPTVCPQSTVLIVPVFNPPIPVISLINPVCNNAPTVALQASPQGGVWSGNSGVSFVGIQTPSLNQIGVNTVSYTAGQGTCTATNSRSFVVSQFNSAALSGTINQLCVSNAPVNLLSLVQNSTGVWSGIATSNSAFNPAGLPTGIYTVTYNTVSSPNQTLCPDVRTLSISVLNPATPNIVQVPPVCSIGAPVQLSVTPATGQWVTSPFLSSSGVFTPSLSAIGSNMVQYMIGTATCNAMSTKYINTEAFVPADIVQSLPDLCNNSSIVSLAPLTLNNLGSWSGPGVIGVNYNPSVSGSGNFNLVYQTASSPSGLCPDVDTLAIRVYSLAPPVISPAGPFCNNALPQQLKVSPVGGIFAGSNNQGLDFNGVFNPALAVIGNNLISYSISSGPCIAFAQSTIAVEEFISADIVKQPDIAYCVNQSPFNLMSFVRNPTGNWFGPGVSNNMFDPSKANIGESNILVYRTNSTPNVMLCPDASTMVIKVKNFEPVTALSSVQGNCAPVVATFNSPSKVVGKGTWNFGDGSEQAQGFNVTHTFTSPGTYNILYKFEDNEAPGCSSFVHLPIPVVVHAKPDADFSMDREELTINDARVQLTNETKNLQDNEYLWTVQGQGQRFELHPLVEFDKIGKYQIKLEATSVKGCKSEKTRLVDVKSDFQVFIPNSFSPNDDGVNDRFKPVFSPYGLDNNTYELMIFDRWGHVIYTGKDPNQGWDGSFQNKGNLELKEDSYNYRLRFRDLDGQSYERQGVVILLK